VKPTSRTWAIEPLLAVILWGGVYPGTKIALRELPLIDVISLRTIVAALSLGALSGRAAQSPSTRPRWRVVLAVGAAQIAFQILLNAGLQYTTAGISAILLATSPLFTAGWAAVHGRERVSTRHWLGLVSGLVGIVFMARPDGAPLDARHILGAALALGAAVAWVSYSLVIGGLVASAGTIRATAWSMGTAALLFAPVALPRVAQLPWTHVSWQAWLGLLYSATVGMVIAMTLWGRAVQKLGAHQAMVYTYLEPISAVVLAWLVLGESLSPIQVLGTALVFAGMWYAQE